VLNFFELLSERRRKSMSLGVESHRTRSLLVSFLNLIFYFWSLLFLSLHLLIGLYGLFLSSWLVSAWSCLTLLWRSFLFRGRDVLLDRNLFFFYPFFNNFNAFETRHLMDVVAHPNNELELLVLGVCLLNFILSNLSWESWK
jgi:nitrate reductase NapE component